MDIEILRTFVEVHRTRHFAKAAENLFVTQAAVSARIAQLESRIGERVFTRARNNIQLTPAGHRLLIHAETILGAWQRAMTEIAGPEDTKLIVLGCLPSIGEMFLDQVLSYFRQSSELSVQIEQLNSQAIISRVREQSLSIGLVYEPPQARDLVSNRVTDLELVMVSSESHPSLSLVHDYVYVDWGTSFSVSHETELAHLKVQLIRVDTPEPALRLLLRAGGTAYLPRHLVQTELDEGRLHIVTEAPVLARSVYVTQSTLADDQSLLIEITEGLVQHLAKS